MLCPRCQTLLIDEDGGLACPSGECGTWLPHDLIVRLIGDPFRPLLELIEQFPRDAYTFIPTTCLVCAQPLKVLYPGIEHGFVLTIGVCGHHGVWLQRASRADFELVYVDAIRRHEREVQLGARREERIAELAEALARGDARLIAARIVELEERVAKLEAK